MPLGHPHRHLRARGGAAAPGSGLVGAVVTLLALVLDPTLATPG